MFFSQPRSLYLSSVGLLLLIALGIFIVFDMLAALTVHVWLTLAYAAIWSLIAAILLWQQPNRQKVLIISIFLAGILAVHFINWDSRKPFLRDFNQIEIGMTVAQADQMMDDYIKFIGPAAQLTAQGQVVAGKVSYRHTRWGWGNSDIGVLTIEDGRVVETVFYPD